MLNKLKKIYMNPKCYEYKYGFYNYKNLIEGCK